jgi:hypothetical protein
MFKILIVAVQNTVSDARMELRHLRTARAKVIGGAQLGISIVMLDVLYCGGSEKAAKRIAFYTSYGFQPLPSNG